MSNYWFECVNCGKTWDSSEWRYLCPNCSKDNSPDKPPKGVLWIRYIFPENPSQLDVDELLFHLWPIKSQDSFPILRVGNTPLYSFSYFENEKLDFQLLIKDDSQNPSYSFKDRASYLVSAFAKENNWNTIVAASTGNAGSSLAAMCAANHQKAVILLPHTSPKAKLIQVQMYGAELIKIKGNYDDAYEESLSLSKKNNWFNRNTAYNPLTIEGKKSVSYEVYDQLKGECPQMIFVPVGDGVIISGVYKGFEDLLQMGLIKEMPTIVAVQAQGSANIIRNIKNSILEFPKASTIADSIAVDVPRNFYMVVHYLKKYNGKSIAVTDKQIMEAAFNMSTAFGLFAEPASAAAFAGFIHWSKENGIPKDIKVLILHTGSGLKDVEAIGQIKNVLQ